MLHKTGSWGPMHDCLHEKVQEIVIVRYNIRQFQFKNNCLCKMT